MKTTYFDKQGKSYFYNQYLIKNYKQIFLSIPLGGVMNDISMSEYFKSFVGSISEQIILYSFLEMINNEDDILNEYLNRSQYAKLEEISDKYKYLIDMPFMYDELKQFYNSLDNKTMLQFESNLVRYINQTINSDEFVDYFNLPNNDYYLDYSDENQLFNELPEVINGYLIENSDVYFNINKNFRILIQFAEELYKKDKTKKVIEPVKNNCYKYLSENEIVNLYDRLNNIKYALSYK
ncbi:MAG: hypothetical protein KatS3mg096_597 [Candidatus Parcubacteria bacterium]|nr:MAG: hypothetical protein KatS3mg096_597 [Candidatus Parcubacteria bacterium]